MWGRGDAYVPTDTMPLGQKLVRLLHADALNTAQLIHGPPLRRVFPEPERIHLAYHPQPRVIIEREACLQQQTIRARAAGLPSSVEAHPGFTHPYQQCARPGRPAPRPLG